MDQQRENVEHIISEYRLYEPDDDAGPELITKAYAFADTAHRGVVRKSHEPYITHPLKATEELMVIRPDLTTILGCLLHDCVDDGAASIENIEKEFGEDVAQIVERIGIIGRIKYRGNEATISRIQKSFVAMSQDIRVMFVKFADRIHNLQTLRYHDDAQKADRIALESLMIYAPIAARLGLYHFKTILEEEAFRWLNPDIYTKITGELAHLTVELESFVTHSLEEIGKIIPDGVPFEVSHRVKKPYSIYRKMKKRGFENVSELYDVFALRILTDTVEHCYQILGLIHGHWTPILENLKDYIGSPKTNGYRSLHTTIMGLYDERRSKRTEVQIRTFDMHEEAEYGAAAHFAYKEGEYFIDVDWIEHLGEKYVNHIREGNYFEEIEEEICILPVFVLTPRGDVKELPHAATPVDFAYAIHSDVGHTTTGAKVNDRMVPLSTRLESGDIVEIITDKNSKPSPSWLDFVTSSKARHQISIELKRTSGERDRVIERGRQLVDEYLKENFGEQLDDRMSHLDVVDGAHMDLVKKEQLLYVVGMGRRRPSALFRHRKTKDPERKDGEAIFLQEDSSITQVIVGGQRHLDIRLAGCCQPKFPDDIIAVVRRDGTCSVHKVGCRSLLRSNPERQLEAYWETLSNKGRHERIVLTSDEDDPKLLGDITHAFYALGMNIIDIRCEKNGKTTFYLGIEVPEKSGDPRIEIRAYLSDHLPRIQMT